MILRPEDEPKVTDGQSPPSPEVSSIPDQVPPALDDNAPTPSGSSLSPEDHNKSHGDKGGRLSSVERQARLALLTSHPQRRRFLAAAASSMFGLLLALSVVIYLMRLPASGPSSTPSGLAWIALVLALAGLVTGAVLFIPLGKLCTQVKPQSPARPAIAPLIAAMLAGTLAALGAYVGFGLNSTGQVATYSAPAPGVSTTSPTSSVPTTSPPSPPSSLPTGTTPGPPGANGILTTQVQSNKPCPLASPRSRTGSPRVTAARVAENSTSLAFHRGSQLYVYGYATGGAQASTTLAKGSYASVNDASKNLVANLAITTSNTNSYATRTADNALIGAALNNFASCSISYATDPQAGAARASATFKVAKKGSLAVIIALSGGGQAITLTGPTNMQVDAVSPTSAKTAVVITQASLNTGKYTVTESTSPRIPGVNSANDPNVGDLLAVLVLSPG